MSVREGAQAIARCNIVTRTLADSDLVTGRMGAGILMLAESHTEVEL